MWCELFWFKACFWVGEGEGRGSKVFFICTSHFQALWAGPVKVEAFLPSSVNQHYVAPYTSKLATKKKKRWPSQNKSIHRSEKLADVLASYHHQAGEKAEEAGCHAARNQGTENWHWPSSSDWPWWLTLGTVRRRILLHCSGCWTVPVHAAPRCSHHRTCNVVS